MTAAGGDIYDRSPPGSWRAALTPGRSCAVCAQSVCGHSDLEFAGIVPPLDGQRRPDAGARPELTSSHATGDSRG